MFLVWGFKLNSSTLCIPLDYCYPFLTVTSYTTLHFLNPAVPSSSDSLHPFSFLFFYLLAVPHLLPRRFSSPTRDQIRVSGTGRVLTTGPSGKSPLHFFAPLHPTAIMVMYPHPTVYLQRTLTPSLPTTLKLTSTFSWSYLDSPLPLKSYISLHQSNSSF